MSQAACTDDEFIALWKELKSATRMAEVLGTNIRSVYSRRTNIEGKYKIQLAADDLRAKILNVTLPENGIRVNVDIDDGVLIVGSDAHYYPGIVSTAHRAFVTAVKELTPKMVIMNGDAFDGATISRHGRIGWEKRPTVKQELEAVSDRLGEVQEVAGNAKLHWTFGNHDLRFSTRLASHAHEFEGVHGFSLTDHFQAWKFSTSIMVNDSCMIKHRTSHGGLHAVHNNTLKSGISIVTGHLHSLKVTYWTDYTGTRYGVDTGTLANPFGPQFTYGEDDPKNHRSGFAVLTFYKGKLLPPELVEVIDEDEGLICFRGQVVSV